MTLFRPSLLLLRTTLLVVMAANGVPGQGQGTWRLDSLMRTWYVQRTIQARQIPFSRHFGPDTMEARAEWTDTSPALPGFYDGEVARAIEIYGGTKRTEFRLLLGLAEIYRPMIAERFRAEGVPEELADLPLALSAMNPQCASDRGESGLWMLTWPVALRHGLRISADLDERRNDTKSTIVAARHLKELHARYNDWNLAVLAFACGPAQVEAAMLRSGGERTVQALYPHLDAPYRDLIPTLIAMHWLAHEASGPHPRPIAPSTWETVDTVRFPASVRFTNVARATRVPEAQLRALNPELTGRTVPQEHPLLLPQREHFDFTSVLDSMAALERATLPIPLADTTASDTSDEAPPAGTRTVYYRIRSGDALGTIAQRFNVSVADLQLWNELKSEAIDAGEELTIHVPLKTTGTPDRKTSTYTVRRGDTLDGIAKRYRGISAQDIMRHNGISSRIRPGQKLKIPAP
ncbi:MAG TPA: LysM peptidoglycan-binding domain-containing protein [Flavobacteriales bacterium]